MKNRLKDTPELRAAIDAIDLSMPLAKSLHPKEGDGWTEERATKAFADYRKFLLLAVTSEHPVVPTHDIDTAWHRHILDTRAYLHDCINAFGFFLHHFPYFGMRGEEDAKNLSSSFEVTQAAWAERFGSPMVAKRDAMNCTSCGADSCGSDGCVNKACSGQVGNGLDTRLFGALRSGPSDHPPPCDTDDGNPSRCDSGLGEPPQESPSCDTLRTSPRTSPAPCGNTACSAASEDKIAALIALEEHAQANERRREFLLAPLAGPPCERLASSSPLAPPRPVSGAAPPRGALSLLWTTASKPPFTSPPTWAFFRPP